MAFYVRQYRDKILCGFAIVKNLLKTAAAVIGSVGLSQFFNKNDFILGTPLFVLVVLGVITYLKSIKKTVFAELILVPGIFFTYLAAHSIYLWQGMGSLGLIRVLAGVTPLAGLIALRGLNTLAENFTKPFPFGWPGRQRASPSPGIARQTASLTG